MCTFMMCFGKQSLNCALHWGWFRFSHHLSWNSKVSGNQVREIFAYFIDLKLSQLPSLCDLMLHAFSGSVLALGNGLPICREACCICFQFPTQCIGYAWMGEFAVLAFVFCLFWLGRYVIVLNTIHELFLHLHHLLSLFFLCYLQSFGNFSDCLCSLGCFFSNSSLSICNGHLIAKLAMLKPTDLVVDAVSCVLHIHGWWMAWYWWTFYLPLVLIQTHKSECHLYP